MVSTNPQRQQPGERERERERERVAYTGPICALIVPHLGTTNNYNSAPHNLHTSGFSVYVYCTVLQEHSASADRPRDAFV